MKFRRLFVALDCTRDAECAVAVAGCIASSLGAEVRLAAVLPWADPEPNAIKSAFSYLDRVAHQLTGAGVRVGTQVRTGLIADAVLSGVELVAADLLVVATCVEDVFAIAARCRVPVVLVPPHASARAKNSRMLAPLDDSLGASLAMGTYSPVARSAVRGRG